MLHEVRCHPLSTPVLSIGTSICFMLIVMVLPITIDRVPISKGWGPCLIGIPSAKFVLSRSLIIM